MKYLKKSLAHERMITKNINNLVDIGMKEKDNATLNMLQWFINEQVEEEANAEEILQQLKLIKGEGQGILLIDRELKTRVFVDSTAVRHKTSDIRNETNLKFNISNLKLIL